IDLVGASKEVVWVGDLPKHPHLSHALEPEVVAQVRFGAGAPIRLQDGRDIGVLIIVDTRPKAYDARLARRLQDLADLIADDFARHQAVLAKARAEAEAAAARATLSAVVESSPVALAMTDREMRLVQVSPRWREERGVGDMAIEGRSLYDLFPNARGRWSAIWDRVLAGETVRGPRVDIDMPDGSTLWMRVELTPWREPNGAVGGMLMMSVDITDMVEALEASKRTAQRLRLAMDIAELNLWELDVRRGKVSGEGWEDSAFTRAEDEEALAADLFSAIHPDDRPAAEALWARHVEDGTPYRATYRILQNDAPPLWIQSATEAVRDEAGEIVRVLGVVRNVDAAKRAEIALARARDEAEAANRAKSEFLANMSHEIRTPLNGVMGVASALARTGLDASQREMLGLIESSALTLERLLSDVLDLARIEAGRLEIRPEAVDLAAAVRDVGALFEPSARQKGLDFDVRVAPAAEGTFAADGARIRQILTNLVSNAVKFTAAGDVRLGLEAQPTADGARFTFTVEDTGIGMDEAAMDRLFQRFQQADGSITRRFGGTGLGLAISRSLSEAMGGALSVGSAPGRGSTFRLVLDLPRAAGVAAAAPEPDAPAATIEGLRVLLAEDHPTNRRVVELILETAGVALTSVENGAEAVDAWLGGRFDLVLMDMQMPVMDGLTAIRAIRCREAESGRPRTLICSLTANALPEDEAACRAAGADGHLTKPITAAALLAAVHAAAQDRAEATRLTA
ncbi:MAG TPA: ATP-binding protein, partial [Caulobacteraceae bacterium]|nr:ATP-binding protein [Caulobacteraceae bacterium]